jgi:hypothetical protein
MAQTNSFVLHTAKAMPVARPMFTCSCMDHANISDKRPAGLSVACSQIEIA